MGALGTLLDALARLLVRSWPDFDAILGVSDRFQPSLDDPGFIFDPPRVDFELPRVEFELPRVDFGSSREAAKRAQEEPKSALCLSTCCGDFQQIIKLRA